MNYSVTQRGLFLAQSTQKAQMLQTVFNIGYEKFEDTQCRFFQAQSKSRGAPTPKGAALGYPKKKGDRSPGAPPERRLSRLRGHRKGASWGRFRGIVRKKERKWNSEMIMRTEDNQLSYLQSHGVQMQISEKNAYSRVPNKRDARNKSA